MNFQNSKTIIDKDFSIFKKRKGILYSLIFFPLTMAIGLTAIIGFVNYYNHVSFELLLPIINAFSFLFIIIASILPTAMASYSIAGEKVEKSLEPLLATPMTDSEILLGKILSAFIPSIVATIFGSVIFMIAVDVISIQQVNYLFYPNWTVVVFWFLVSPLACFYSVECSIIISTRVNDIRTAQSFGGILFLPFMGLYIMGDIQVISLDTNALLIISVILLLVDIILFFISKTTFCREEILTRGK